ncbi:hypothetical protein PIB30_058286 [Stylosanthes scabra]|uniref:Uncharacterized protein n=1 Tax=Stylosanthes scabra TaxID=79078 RepID=A0ABU6XHV8_9FABA|nr:hypothetical protein [Stylosanthes scabra]
MEPAQNIQEIRPSQRHDGSLEVATLFKTYKNKTKYQSAGRINDLPIQIILEKVNLISVKVGSKYGKLSLKGTFSLALLLKLRHGDLSKVGLDLLFGNQPSKPLSLRDQLRLPTFETLNLFMFFFFQDFKLCFQLLEILLCLLFLSEGLHLLLLNYNLLKIKHLQIPNELGIPTFGLISDGQARLH